MVKEMMMDIDERDFYCEAVAILSGASMMLPTIEHLRALQEAMQEEREVGLIRVANMVETLKISILSMP
jgi:hypothetical protein